MQTDWEYRGNTQQGVRVDKFKDNQVSFYGDLFSSTPGTQQNGYDIDATWQGISSAFQNFPGLQGMRREFCCLSSGLAGILGQSPRTFHFSLRNWTHFLSSSSLPPLLLSSLQFFPLFFFFQLYSQFFRHILQTCTGDWSYQFQKFFLINYFLKKIPSSSATPATGF